jgi:hypothetical protein
MRSGGGNGATFGSRAFDIVARGRLKRSQMSSLAWTLGAADSGMSTLVIKV